MTRRTLQAIAYHDAAQLAGEFNQVILALKRWLIIADSIPDLRERLRCVHGLLLLLLADPLMREYTVIATVARTAREELLQIEPHEMPTEGVIQALDTVNAELDRRASILFTDWLGS